LPPARAKVRLGFTTGACAAAAAKAATMALLGQRTVSMVDININEKERVTFPVTGCRFDTLSAECSVVKDAGDDPDVTDGMAVCATVSRCDQPGIIIDGGTGVGKVSKPGLELPVGAAAINPVPRQMISQAVNEILADARDVRGLAVVISAPDGIRLAARTLNERLGISGGISILGTSGRVIPYSTAAYRATITLGIRVARAAGYREVALTTGRRSEKFAQAELKLPEECYIQTGDYIGLALDECHRQGVKTVYIWGMVGKLSKLAGGEFYTHVDRSRVDIARLARLAAKLGLDSSLQKKLGEAVTAHHLMQMLPGERRGDFAAALCREAAGQCRRYLNESAAVEIIMSDYQGNIRGRAHVG